MDRFSSFLLAVALVAGGTQLALAKDLTVSGAKAAVPRKSGALPAALQGKPVLVRIHADWCPACQATQPTIDRIRHKYGPKIAFVEFNVTNAKTAFAAAQKAKKLGLERFFEAYKSATSTVGIVNPLDGSVIATFYNDSDAGDYSKAIDRLTRELTQK